MLDNILVPSYFGSPFLTTIPETRYDAKGRQMSFIESEVQRLERMAFVNVSKSRNSTPSPNHSPRSGASSPLDMKLISEPYGDPIELMANRLAEEFMLNSADELSSDDEHVIYSTPKATQRVPFASNRASPSSKAPFPSTTFQPGHRRKRSSLSSIPEED